MEARNVGCTRKQEHVGKVTVFSESRRQGNLPLRLPTLSSKTQIYKIPLGFIWLITHFNLHLNPKPSSTEHREKNHHLTVARLSSKFVKEGHQYSITYFIRNHQRLLWLLKQRILTLKPQS